MTTRPQIKNLGADWDSAGSPEPLGATLLPDGSAYNFALYSEAATAVTLMLYTAADYAVPFLSRTLDSIANKTGPTWHYRVAIADCPGCIAYAYQIDGPATPGNSFDSAKVLFDPGARTIFRPPGFDRVACSNPGSTAGKAPLGELPTSDPPFDWSGDVPIRHTSNTVIYEMHVRGFTKQDAGVAVAKQGTFGGIIDKIPYLLDLGITAIELLPVYDFDPEDGGNYWGYMPLSFFSMHFAYCEANSGPARADEFRAMVKALHAANIEVILDVVYNHTSEQGAGGPEYCFKGIDNSSYYLMGPDPGTYRDDTGCGNVFHTSNPAVRNLVLDSMRYWVTEMHVDGFRFDLASIFSINDDGSINTNDSTVIDAIDSDPILAGIRLIAEPWDAAGAYQLGVSFPGKTWSQWNGQFRDDVRSFVKGDNSKIFAMMHRVYGSDDLFPDTLPTSCHPFQSINFIDCHDGFCLYDLVSYNDKHNLANGQNNTDGSNTNFSWNSGWEGDTGAPPDVLALRKQQIKNFITLLMVSNGAPMFVMGDEFMNTQGGNNNPYNQDNATTWLDWSKLTTNADIYRYFKTIIAFRKSHSTLCRATFWHTDVTWYGANGPLDAGDTSHSFAYCINGKSQNDNNIYVIANAYWQDITFTIGAPGPWKRVVDTAQPTPTDILPPGSEEIVTGSTYLARARSVVVLIQ